MKFLCTNFRYKTMKCMLGISSLHAHATYEEYKFIWIVVIKIFAFILPSQPFLGRHFGFHIFFHNRGRTLFWAVFGWLCYCVINASTIGTRPWMLYTCKQQNCCEQWRLIVMMRTCMLIVMTYNYEDMKCNSEERTWWFNQWTKTGLLSW